MTTSDYLGLGGRLSAGPSALLVRTGFSTETRQANHLDRWMGLADIAHVLALRDAEVLPERAGNRLLGALVNMMDTSLESRHYDPSHGDVYNNREHILREELGDDAGWLALGRTRREAGRIAFYLASRTALLELHDAVTAFVDVASTRALANVESYWADLTYWQPAQVSTFGHYLLSFAHEAGRHLQRIEDAWNRCAIVPIAAGGVAGTTVRVSRTAYLDRLGLSSTATTSRDAMWSVDGLLDLVFVADQATVTVSRMAEDFMLFATAPFGYVRLHDSHCRASVYLPQKRNPYALSVVRGGAGLVAGRVNGVMTSVRTASAQTDNWIYNYGEVLDTLKTATDLCALTTEVLHRCELNTARMADRALDGFSEAADLAEWLVSEQKVDYRTAHSVVAELATAAEKRGDSRFSEEDYRALAERTGAQPVPSEPEALVAARANAGSAAPAQVRESARQLRRRLTKRRAWRAQVATVAQAVSQGLLSEASASTCREPGEAS